MSSSSVTDAPAWSCSAPRCSRRPRVVHPRRLRVERRHHPGGHHRRRRGRRWRGGSCGSSTSRTSARVVLAESEARFRALVQHATDIVIVLSERGRGEYVSPAVDTVFGEPADDLIGTQLRRLPRRRRRRPEPWRCTTALIEHPDEPIATEFHVSDGDGRRWIEATWTNQLHEPAVSGFVGNLRDITDRKRADAFGSDETRVLRAHPLRRAGARRR